MTYICLGKVVTKELFDIHPVYTLTFIQSFGFVYMANASPVLIHILALFWSLPIPEENIWIGKFIYNTFHSQGQLALSRSSQYDQIMTKGT